MTDSDDENVSLLIRCALQTFDDLPLDCPSSWTVEQLKNKLADVCPSKPAPKRQRLIYAGHCLHDEHTLKTVFERRAICDGHVHVIHLVSPPTNLNALSDIRRRKNIKKSDGATSAAQPISPPSTVYNNHHPNYLSWTNAAPNSPYMSQYIPPSTQYHNAYEAYMIMYNNYMHQAMTAWGSYPQHLAISESTFLGQQQPAVTNLPQVPQRNDALQPEAAAPAANVAAAPAAGGIVQEAVVGDVEIAQRDFLDVVYKAIRMCFLIMLVYVYSSAERFLGVLFFIVVVWFVQARRDRFNRQRADREVAAAVNNVRQQQEISDEGNGTGSRGNNVAPAEPREPSGWVVFWSTCYTFITSFFSSLIPDNPVPVNMN